MASVKISALPAATTVAGTDERESNQSGTSRRATLALEAAFGHAAPGGRLTLTTATPVTTSDVTAAATIYYALYEHGFFPLYDGTAWKAYAFTELSLALDSNSGHTGYHQSGKNFDVFIDYNSGTPRLVTGPAWTNDTTRADAIARKDGRWTNNASMTVRFGTSSGNTATMAANTGLYVGTIRCTADGQTEDSLAKRFTFNTYHRVRRPMRVVEATNTWTYTTLTYRQANNSAANQIDFLCGLSDIEVTARARARCENSSGVIEVYCAIGLDSATTPAASGLHARAATPAANTPVNFDAQYLGFPGVGRHYLAWLEQSNATGTTTWSGDAALSYSLCGISGEIWA